MFPGTLDLLIGSYQAAVAGQGGSSISSPALSIPTPRQEVKAANGKKNEADEEGTDADGRISRSWRTHGQDPRLHKQVINGMLKSGSQDAKVLNSPAS